MNCANCNEEFDDKVDAHCYCNVHKLYHCWACGDAGSVACYTPGVPCALFFLTNPAWTVNLVKTKASGEK